MPLLCFVFTILFLAFVFPFYSAHSFHDDGQSLLEFKKLITIDPHLSMGNWIPAVPLCNWTGVTCSHRHIDRVVSINLTAMNLGGTISPYLGNLTFLHSLDLSNNELRGHIPTKLARLFRLRNLWLWENQLEGNIPQDMGSLTHLQQLLLSKNNLKGTISSFRNPSALYFRNFKNSSDIHVSFSNLEIVDRFLQLNCVSRLQCPMFWADTLPILRYKISFLNNEQSVPEEGQKHRAFQCIYTVLFQKSIYNMNMNSCEILHSINFKNFKNLSH